MKALAKVLIPAVLMISGSAFAGIADTKHNLAGGTTDDDGQMCVYCHTPHTNSTNNSPPLWNRAAHTAQSYTLYTSSTIQMTIDQPGAESQVCLSCHDGTVALDSIVNTPNIGWTQGTTRTMSTGVAGYMGIDLRSEHPVGVQWDTSTGSGDPDFWSQTIVENTNGIPLYGANNTVECASCHDVHEYTNIPFLRNSNSNSELCLDCHNK